MKISKSPTSLSYSLQTKNSEPVKASSSDSSLIYEITRSVTINSKIWAKNDELTDTHPNDEDLRQIGFKRGHINIKTGEIDDRRFRAVKPKPFRDMAFKPEDARKYFKDVAGFGSNTNFHIARVMGLATLDLLGSIPREDHPDKPAVEYDGWFIQKYVTYHGRLARAYTHMKLGKPKPITGPS